MKKILLLISLFLILITSIFIIVKIRKDNTEKTIGYTKEEAAILKRLSSISYFHLENASRYLSLLKNGNYTDKEAIMRVNIGIDKPFYTDVKTIENPDDNLVLANKYNKFPENYVPKDLVQVESISMKKEAGAALEKMAKDMRENGLTINLISGYRSEERQRVLYNSYVKKSGSLEADTYSARPGFSEHQSGLAIDMSNTYTLTESFENTKEFEYLSNNAYKYGFILRYKKDKVYMTGYIYEPWHYRYVGLKAAKIIHEKDLTFEEYCVLYRGLY